MGPVLTGPVRHRAPQRSRRFTPPFPARAATAAAPGRAGIPPDGSGAARHTAAADAASTHGPTGLTTPPDATGRRSPDAVHHSTARRRRTVEPFAHPASAAPLLRTSVDHDRYRTSRAGPPSFDGAPHAPIRAHTDSHAEALRTAPQLPPPALALGALPHACAAPRKPHLPPQPVAGAHTHTALTTRLRPHSRIPALPGPPSAPGVKRPAGPSPPAHRHLPLHRPRTRHASRD